MGGGGISTWKCNVSITLKEKANDLIFTKKKGSGVMDKKLTDETMVMRPGLWPRLNLADPNGYHGHLAELSLAKRRSMGTMSTV
ncbi:hypothetical protein CDAR_198491 [Caerostris darwini]|uniref:Uncharacterized protein n=1 Tax=Caerostris darwini TaxID=1538125 RepID=A0AAV4W6G3_9ARAC|nr:hypothetical protein CDAR_198491 [Caerostris darwini]